MSATLALGTQPDLDLMTPSEYLDAFARPTFAEFEREPTSTRRAWLAAVTLFHFRDYLAAEQKIKREEMHRNLLAAFPDFAAISDIANAGKHFERERGPRKGLRPDHFQAGHSAAFSDGKYFDDGTSFADAPDVIRVEFRGEQIDALNLCRRTLQFIETLVSP